MSNCCNTQYLGVFCTDTDTTVFAFVSFKDGVPEYKYFDTTTNEPYDGTIETTCTSGASGDTDDYWGTD